MTSPIRPRRLTALFAAYVVALQTLLLPLSVAAGNPFAGSLCISAQAGNDTRTPVNHDTGCACAAGCGVACVTQVLLTPPGTSFEPALNFVRVETTVVSLAPVAQTAARHPHNPRAPPRA